MAFNVPSLSEVSRMVENGFSSSFYGKSGTLRVGILKVLSKVVAGAAYLPILFCQYIWRNSFVDTADAENLVRFGAWYNIPHKVASYSRGLAFVKGSCTLPAGTILENDDGKEYETISAATMTSSGVNVQVVAVNPGNEYNLSYSTDLHTRDDVTGFTSAIVGNGGIYGGVSVGVVVDGVTEYWGETIEEYRSRIKYRRQHPPMGGSDSDYRQWAMKFSQVTDVWVFGNYPTTNSVSIYVSDFNAANPQLNSTELDEIRSYITSDTRKPITANVLIASPVALNVGMTIAIPTINEANKNKVTDVMVEYLRKFAPGEKFTLAGCKTAIISSGVISDCEVSSLKVSGQPVASGEYTLAKSGSSSGISGNVINVYLIPENLVFIAKA